MLWPWLLACPHRAPDPEAAVREAVAASDAAWEHRADAGLDPVGEPLLSVWPEHLGHPEVGWRLIRWRVALGTAATDPGVARAAFAEARTDLVVCLDGDALFAQRRAAGGWAAALAELPPDRRACAAWGALAWVRWSLELGPEAASLDLPTIDALVEAGGAEPAAAVARGLSLGTRPVWAGQDPDQAAVLLRRASGADPGSVVLRVDLWRVTGEPALATELDAITPRRPEDRGAWERR